MIEYQSSTIIACPASDVFSFISDPQNLGRWRLDTTEFEILTPGTIVKGSRWIERTSYLGQKASNEIEVVETVDGTAYTTRTMVQQTIPFLTTYSAEATSEGTRFTIKVQGEIVGVLKMAEPLIRKQMITSLDSNLRQLKQLMETGR